MTRFPSPCRRHASPPFQLTLSKEAAACPWRPCCRAWRAPSRCSARSRRAMVTVRHARVCANPWDAACIDPDSTLRALLCVGRRDTTLGLMSWCLLALTGAVRAVLPPHVHLGPTIRPASKALAVKLAPCKERPSPQPGLREQGHSCAMIPADHLLACLLDHNCSKMLPC